MPARQSGIYAHFLQASMSGGMEAAGERTKVAHFLLPDARLVVHFPLMLK